MAHAGQPVLKTVNNVSFDSKTVLPKSIYRKYYAFDFNMAPVLMIKHSPQVSALIHVDFNSSNKAQLCTAVFQEMQWTHTQQLLQWALCRWLHRATGHRLSGRRNIPWWIVEIRRWAAKAANNILHFSSGHRSLKKVTAVLGKSVICYCFQYKFQCE